MRQSSRDAVLILYRNLLLIFCVALDKLLTQREYHFLHGLQQTACLAQQQCGPPRHAEVCPVPCEYLALSTLKSHTQLEFLESDA